MRIVVVGCGSIGKRHIRNLKTLGYEDLLAVDPTESRRAEGLESGAAEAYATLEEALDRGKVDAGFVCTPTSMHITTAQTLADAGVNLFIEKPLCKDLEGSERLLATTKEKKLVTFIGYCLRFDENALRFKKLLDQGSVGRPLYAFGDYSSYLPSWHPFEDYRSFYMAKADQGGGALLDDSHILDVAQMMLGDFVRVYSEVGTLSDLEIDSDDCYDLLLTTGNGVRVGLHGDLFSREEREKFMVVGTEGTMTWEIGKREVVVSRPTDRTATVYKSETDYSVMYLKETEHFLSAVSKGEPLDGMDLEHAIKIQKILVAAQENAGGQAVKL